MANNKRDLPKNEEVKEESTTTSGVMSENEVAQPEQPVQQVKTVRPRVFVDLAQQI